MSLPSARLAFSCVVDAPAIFALQAAWWMQSLQRCAQVSPDQIYVHCLPGVAPAFVKWCRGQNVHVIDIEPHPSKHRYCNKQLQLNTNFGNIDYVVLNDCDIFYLDKYEIAGNSLFYGRPVDLPNPPLPILQTIFEIAGFAAIDSIPVGIGSASGSTLPGNCNGGFYVIARKILPDLRDRWDKWVTWCMERQNIFGGFEQHVDQVAMALALRDLDIVVEPLDSRHNIPTHLDPNLIETLAPVAQGSLHYHRHQDEHGRLLATGVAWIDEQIAHANRMISAILKESFDNSIFWNYRYERWPELGSGVGSRGEFISLKRNILEPFALLAHSIVDWGCGDLEVVKDLPLKNYLGIDVSQDAIKCAADKRPDCRFAVADSEEARHARAEVAFCLDVAIHQPTRSTYLQLMADIARSCTDLLLVSGYEDRPSMVSEIVYYYEPISRSLQDLGCFSRIEEIGRYRELTVYAAVHRNGRYGTNDAPIGFANFARALNEVPQKGELIDLVRLSSERLGFFTNHYPRVFEYSWLAHALGTELCGKRILDVGAGVNPLPFYFAERGADVITVDAHPLNRANSPRHAWNEWGYLDYSNIDQRIVSINADVSQIGDVGKFDVIYSISVVEHMPARTRRKVFELCSKLMMLDGYLYLTLDLVPGENTLWNLSEGKEVEARAEHGKLGSIKRELRRLGFIIEDVHVRRDIHDSRTDIAFVTARRRPRLFSFRPHPKQDRIRMPTIAQ